MSLFVDPQDFLDLGFGLQHEVLGGSAAEDQHAALPFPPFGIENQGRGFIDIQEDIESWF